MTKKEIDDFRDKLTLLGKDIKTLQMLYSYATKNLENLETGKIKYEDFVEKIDKYDDMLKTTTLW